jgi:hypothetical protein
MQPRRNSDRDTRQPLRRFVQPLAPGVFATMGF